MLYNPVPSTSDIISGFVVIVIWFTYIYHMKLIKKKKLVTFDLSLFEELEHAAKGSGRSVEAQIRHWVNYGINSLPDSK